MTKSTDSSPQKTGESPAQTKPKEDPVLWQMFTMEGGMSLLLLFPLVVLFFLKMAVD